MTDEQIEAALNACTFGQTKETRCKNCALDSDKEPCITNLHLAALEYIGRLKHRAEVAERALKDCVEYYSYSALCPVLDCNYNKACWRKECTSDIVECFKIQAEKELEEERKDDDLSR